MGDVFKKDVLKSFMVILSCNFTQLAASL
jgi:hypothetical protein